MDSDRLIMDQAGNQSGSIRITTYQNHRSGKDPSMKTDFPDNKHRASEPMKWIGLDVDQDIIHPEAEFPPTKGLQEKLANEITTGI